jgi:hypothetical protein
MTPKTLQRLLYIVTAHSEVIYITDKRLPDIKSFVEIVLKRGQPSKGIYFVLGELGCNTSSGAAGP